MNLFQVAKYPVLQGKGETLALCTCWTDPQQLLEEQPQLAERFALMGTLYSKEGVSIMLRNLCLNPQIRYVLVWANGPLSKTAYGRAGREVLEALWRGERDAAIQKELPQEALSIVVENVQLIDVSGVPSEELLAYLDEQTFDVSGEYMEPQSFPEPQRDASQPFPSEKAGWTVHGSTVVNTWVRAVDRVLRYGQATATEYGNQQKVVQSITWVINSEDVHNIHIPDWPTDVLTRVGLAKESVDEYAATLLNPHLPSGITYTYGQRLRNYQGLDQVKAMVDRLKKSKVTRRAVAVTYDPLLDAQANSPPCLNHVQALIEDEYLHLFALFRSHDMFKAGIPNAIGLLGLQTYLAQEAGYKPGRLCITSLAAHIYEEDWNDALQLAECQVRGRLSPLFKEKEDADPRGNVLIRVEDGKIVAELVANGETLYTVSGSPFEVSAGLMRQELLSRHDHIAYIGRELLRAEIALRTNKPYKQDVPLTIEGVQFK